VEAVDPDTASRVTNCIAIDYLNMIKSSTDRINLASKRPEAALSAGLNKPPGACRDGGKS
jgi:hypothetical protein